MVVSDGLQTVQQQARTALKQSRRRQHDAVMRIHCQLGLSNQRTAVKLRTDPVQRHAKLRGPAETRVEHRVDTPVIGQQ